MKIRAKKQKELEAKWAREAASKKQAQARNAAMDAKIACMEEDERKGQRASLSKPPFDLAKWKQQEYAQPSTFQPGAPTSGTHNFSRKPKAAPAQPAKPGLWSRFTSAVTNTVKKVVTPLVNALKKFVTPVANAVKKVVTPVVNTVKEVVAPVVPLWNAVKTKVSNTWNAIKTQATHLWNSARTKLQNGWNTLKTWAHNAKQAIGGFFRKHPVIAWGTASALTIGTAIGARNLYCYGSLLPPVSSLDLAGWIALPLVGLLTTERKRRCYGVFVGLVLGSIIFSACAPKPGTPTPTISICPEPPPKTPTATLTPVPPTATPIPWLSVITDPNQLRSDWKDAYGNPYPHQNDYNRLFVQAAADAGIPAWILKAIAASESSFDVYASNNAGAKSLGQVTGNGVDAVLKSLPELGAAPLVEKEVENAYRWLTEQRIMWLEDQYLKKDESYVAWYKRLANMAQPGESGNCLGDPIACQATFWVRSKIIEGMDARDTSNNPLSGPALETEVTRNLVYAGLVIKVAQKDITTYGMPEAVWSSLSSEDQWLLTFAQYNVGAENSNSVVINAIRTAMEQGETPTWDVIAPILSSTPNSSTADPSDTYLGTVTYAQHILSLVQQGVP